MSSSVSSVGSRLLRGEGDLLDWGLLTGCWSWLGGSDKLFVDSNQVGLRGTARLPG